MISSSESVGKLLQKNFDEGLKVVKNAFQLQDNTSVYNIVGVIYPRLSREQKDSAIHRLLTYLDTKRYDVVAREVTPYIREPLLLSDINIVRPLYWPGLEGGEGEKLIKNYLTFELLRKITIDENGLFLQDKVHSDFLVANAILRSDFCDYGEAYARVAEPEFLNRVLRGLVANRFARRKATEELSNEEIEERTHRLQELWPKSLHDRIEPLRLEGGWVDSRNFR